MEGGAQTFTQFAIDILRAYGLAGLVMAVEGIIIYALWSDNKFLRTTLFETGGKAIEANSAMATAMQALRTDVLTTANGVGRRARGS